MWFLWHQEWGYTNISAVCSSHSLDLVLLMSEVLLRFSSFKIIAVRWGLNVSQIHPQFSILHTFVHLCLSYELTRVSHWFRLCGFTLEYHKNDFQAFPQEVKVSNYRDCCMLICIYMCLKIEVTTASLNTLETESAQRGCLSCLDYRWRSMAILSKLLRLWTWTSIK